MTVDADMLLGRIVAWAEADPNVRALVLVGSRAGEPPPDDLADFDVQVYAETTAPYTQDDAWLSGFATVWVCVRDEYPEEDFVVPTRLVLYEGGLKVDFALYRAEALRARAPEWPTCRVLLDKDRRISVPEPRRSPAEPPSEEEFVRIVQEFWFEAYHVAKYLARGELWQAKARDGEAKAFLLKMIAWHAGARQGWHADTRYGGKHLRSWVEPEVWADLHDTFAHFDAADSWHALRATTGLFRRLARETAAALAVAYPEDVDRHLSGFIAGLERRR